MRDKEKKGEITGATWVFVGALFTILLVNSITSCKLKGSKPTILLNVILLTL